MALLYHIVTTSDLVKHIVSRTSGELGLWVCFHGVTSPSTTSIKVPMTKMLLTSLHVVVILDEGGETSVEARLKSHLRYDVPGSVKWDAPVADLHSPTLPTFRTQKSPFHEELPKPVNIHLVRLYTETSRSTGAADYLKGQHVTKKRAPEWTFEGIDH